MPPQPELDKLVQEMLTTQGMNEKAAAAVMGLDDAKKWQMLQGFQAQQAKAGQIDDIKEHPEHWLHILKLDPQKSDLETLSVMLRQQPAAWVIEFVELKGVNALCEMLELLEKKAFKKPGDFELMGMVLRCLRSLMNMEAGMDAVLGLLDDDDDSLTKTESLSGGSATPRGSTRRRSKEPPKEAPALTRLNRGGLRQLALCIDAKHESSQAAPPRPRRGPPPPPPSPPLPHRAPASDVPPSPRRRARCSARR